MKIKNIVKFIRSISLILVILGGLSLIITNSIYSHKEVEYKTICVERGDTIWSIASSESVSNSYYANKDIRYIMDDIISINNINNNSLYINQQIKIPTI